MHNNYNLCRCLYNYIKDGTAVYTDYDCTVMSAVSKVETNASIDIKIYPHPIRGESILEFENPKQRPYELILYDLSGKIIKVYKTTDAYIELSSDVYWNRVLSTSKGGN